MLLKPFNDCVTFFLFFLCLVAHSIMNEHNAREYANMEILKGKKSPSHKQLSNVQISLHFQNR